MEPYIGQIYMFAFNWAPQDYAVCNGALLPLAQYQALYSLIGSIYGGDNRTTVGLPDLRGRVPRGFNLNDSNFDIMDVGVKNGTLNPAYPLAGTATGSVAIAGANLPAHTHTATFTPTSSAQTLNIPGTAGSGAISVAAGAGIDVVPGANGVAPANNGTYYLTGVKAPSAGPVTTTAPDPATKGKLQGLNIAIDASTYRPEIPPASPSVNMVTGGTVAVAANSGNASVTYPVAIAGSTGPKPSPAAAAPNLNPFLALNFAMAVQGIYPVRP